MKPQQLRVSPTRKNLLTPHSPYGAYDESTHRSIFWLFFPTVTTRQAGENSCRSELLSYVRSVSDDAESISENQKNPTVYDVSIMYFSRDF
jgi:hypothetical protein